MTLQARIDKIRTHRSIGKVADPNYMGDCEACGQPWPCREYLRARLVEVEEALRTIAKRAEPRSEAAWDAFEADTYQWLADAPEDGPRAVIELTRELDSIIAAARAVLDKGEQG